MTTAAAYNGAMLSLVNPAWTPEPWVAPVLSLLILAFAPSEVIYRRHGNIKSREDGTSSSWILTSTLVNVGMFILFCSNGIGTIHWQPVAVACVGLIMATTGVFLRYGAIFTLGRYFTSAVMVQPEQTIIQKGPFRFIRHPGYAGALLFGLGAALACANAAAAIFFLVSHGLAFRYRVTLEEGVMLTHFGQAYADYQRRTWRFFPFLY
jgi:protein-S-isoprenylcysteine O-methyltransferase Ste14